MLLPQCHNARLALFRTCGVLLQCQLVGYFVTITANSVKLILRIELARIPIAVCVQDLALDETNECIDVGGTSAAPERTNS
jgi:hypothetical protein